WLAPDVTSDTLATCKYCRVVLKAHKKDLVSHSKTEKHKKATTWEKSAKTCRSISDIYKPVLLENTKIIELKIAAFIAEHCSLLTVNHLISILPQLDPSSDVLKNLKLHRTNDNVEPTKLFEDLFLLYKNLLKRLVVPSQLEKLMDSELVEFNFQKHLMHTASMYFGFDFQNISQELEEKDLLD
ncbi:hypothetical protein PV328_012378, partial [Microctonus aethiopoides]